jgi:hypothetical protein
MNQQVKKKQGFLRDLRLLPVHSVRLVPHGTSRPDLDPDLNPTKKAWNTASNKINKTERVYLILKKNA